MLTAPLRLLTFVVAILLLLELGLRFYYYGTDVFSPAKMNSHTLIMDSEFVQPAADTDIYYELKPNVSGFFAGQPFRTNSAGLADIEYTLDKPANTYRVAVVGSSWSMATGVAMDDTYQAKIEKRLQEAFPERNNEVINFGVEYYGLGEITATARRKAMAYDPDLLILSITSMTPLIRWDDDRAPFMPIKVVPPFWQSVLYSMIMSRLGRQAYAKTSRPLVDPMLGDYSRNIRRGIDEVAEIVANTDTKVVVLWLTHTKQNETAKMVVSNTAARHGFKVIPLHMQALAAEAKATGNPLVGRIGQHPSALGHQLIADKVFQTVWGEPDQ